MTPEYGYTTGDLAAEFGIAPKTLRKKAREARVGGLDLKGRAGFRYSEADRQKLIEFLRPKPEPEKRRRRRAA